MSKPFVLTEASVFVIRATYPAVELPTTVSFSDGEVVPMPTFPPFTTVRSESLTVDEPILKSDPL